MANPSVSATPDLLHGPGETEIYDASGNFGGLPPQVWERSGEGSWRRVDLASRVTRSDSSDPDRDGYFKKMLFPGTAYQVRLYHDQWLNPNEYEDLDRSDASTVVLALSVELQTGF